MVEEEGMEGGWVESAGGRVGEKERRGEGSGTEVPSRL